MRSSLRRICALFLALNIVLCLLGPLSPAAEAAEMKTAIGTVLASSLRLRAGPSTSTEILATASRNDKVIVIRQEGDWYKVVFNLKTGYMHRDYLELDEVKNVKIGYARFESATNVRRKPTTDSAVLATAPGGDTCFIVGFNRGWYKVSFNGQPGYVRSDLVTMLEIPYSNAGSPGNTYHEGGGDSGGSGSGSGGESGGGSGGSEPAPSGQLGSSSMSRDQKLKMIFGTASISDPRTVYGSASEASSHMTTVTVKTWDLNSSGAKYTRTWTITVHKNIAATVKAIFDEIYALPEKPPIHSLGGYRWAGKSEHSVGLALDLNPNENYYCDPKGNALSGSYFRPDSDPYSIPVGGKIDQIFSKYGFKRGIYWNSGYKDYMHYSFFGT